MLRTLRLPGALRLPGHSHRGPLPALTAGQARLAQSLRRDVEELAGGIGERNRGCYGALCAAADWIAEAISHGEGTVRRQGYRIGRDLFENIELELGGLDHPREVVVVGAHYDTVPGSPGANDNGSGVATLIELARRFRTRRPHRTLRLVAFVNEEMPYFINGKMGSQVYARACRRRGDRVVAMLSLETLGYYVDGPRTQRYPPPLSFLYPSVGDFLGFVSNLRSAPLLRRAIGTFRTHARFPSEGGALPALVPGVGWSDHSSFWRQGYRAIMLTDTAPFRYPHYHDAGDTPDKLDYGRLARVVDGIDSVVMELAGGVRAGDPHQGG